MTTTIQTNRKPAHPKPGDPADSIQRGLARLRAMSLEVQTEPLKEMRLEMGLDMQIVYFGIRVPFAGGILLRLPALVTVKPKFYSPTRAQHL